MSALGEPMRELQRQIQGVPKALMLDAVKAVKKTADVEAARAVGSDLAMSNLGRAKLILRDDLKVGTDQTEATLKPPRGSAGAWAIATWGAKAHEIGGPKSKGRGRNKTTTGRRNVRIGDNVRRGPIHHPGARGKGTFEKVCKAAPETVVKACDVALTKAIRAAGWR